MVLIQFINLFNPTTSASKICIHPTLLIYSTKDDKEHTLKNLKPPHNTYNPTMGEDYVDGALFPENNEIPPPARNRMFVRI
jgi:hypothetical protein